MTSWRDAISAQGQDDLDELLNAGLGFAQQQLAKRGEFYPFAAAIDLHGATEMIAPDTDERGPAAADLVDASLASLITRRDRLRAAAVVADVRVPDLGQDAIQVGLEHSEGIALSVLLPYARRPRPGGRPGDVIEYGEVRASSAARRIWA
jgi:hypothetical protein